ncbi:exodeoxyribonuclease III, partial [bacterium]|nr:exodeoxyribonuclease III [bacterium]
MLNPARRFGYSGRVITLNQPDSFTSCAQPGSAICSGRVITLNQPDNFTSCAQPGSAIRLFRPGYHV